MKARLPDKLGSNKTCPASTIKKAGVVITAAGISSCASHLHSVTTLVHARNCLSAPDIQGVKSARNEQAVGILIQAWLHMQPSRQQRARHNTVCWCCKRTAHMQPTKGSYQAPPNQLHSMRHADRVCQKRQSTQRAAAFVPAACCCCAAAAGVVWLWCCSSLLTASSL